jgi:VanZ family protein
MGRLRYWIIPAIWLAVMWTFSTHYFTSDQTRQWVIPLLHWFFPQANYDRLRWMHYVIRKAGHVFNYLILSLLLVWSIRRGRPSWQIGWALGAWAIAACYSVIDELHQALVPGRSASWRDVLLDSAAAALAQVIVGLYRRPRGAAKCAE